ncbi:MAG: hypothetical protein KatS3mg083_282 [Candidatus Dojkabacteria bacterium]|nr:MAG: hypothetical protein KatS3mg083_282 [Candidatus Dojkabacteria bacterium]
MNTKSFVSKFYSKLSMNVLTNDEKNLVNPLIRAGILDVVTSYRDQVEEIVRGFLKAREVLELYFFLATLLIDKKKDIEYLYKLSNNAYNMCRHRAYPVYDAVKYLHYLTLYTIANSERAKEYLALFPFFISGELGSIFNFALISDYDLNVYDSTGEMTYNSDHYVKFGSYSLDGLLFTTCIQVDRYVEYKNKIDLHNHFASSIRNNLNIVSRVISPLSVVAQANYSVYSRELLDASSASAILKTAALFNGSIPTGTKIMLLTDGSDSTDIKGILNALFWQHWYDVKSTIIAALNIFSDLIYNNVILPIINLKRKYLLNAIIELNRVYGDRMPKVEISPIYLHTLLLNTFVLQVFNYKASNKHKRIHVEGPLTNAFVIPFEEMRELFTKTMNAEGFRKIIFEGLKDENGNTIWPPYQELKGFCDQFLKENTTFRLPNSHDDIITFFS